MMVDCSSNIISVIIPIFNEAIRIQEYLDVWRSWRANPLVEIIFVDGGSTDGGSRKLLDSGFNCIQSNFGRARQMNAGARHACGRLLWFVHADTDILSFKKSIDWLDTLHRNNANTAQYWGFFRVNVVCANANHYERVMLWFISQCINTRSKITRVSTGDQCQFFSKEIFENLRGFPEQPLLEDVQISKQARKKLPPMVASHTVNTSGRRWQTQGIWRTILQMWKIRFRYWRGVSAESLAREYRQIR
jgi:rSAM/selenodomain-associated transferase 2